MKFVIVCNLYLDTFSNLYTFGRSFGRSYPKHILCILNCYYHIPEMKTGELFSCSVFIIQKTYAEKTNTNGMNGKSEDFPFFVLLTIP